MSDDITARLEKYLAKTLDQPALRVSDLARIPGGASRETYRFRARYGDVERALILRRDPPASLIETDRTTEFRAYRWSSDADVVSEPSLTVPATAIRTGYTEAMMSFVDENKK